MTSRRPARVATLRPPSERDLRRAADVAAGLYIMPHAIIHGGPGREELIDALKYAFHDRHPHQVTFRVQIPESDLFALLPMRILGILHIARDGSSLLVFAEQSAASFIVGTPTFYYSTADQTGRIPLPPGN